MSLAKPTPRERAKPTRPMPKCECGHGAGIHSMEDGGPLMEDYRGACDRPGCDCLLYVAARVSVRRSPIQRASAPIKAKCATCGHVQKWHTSTGCAECPLTLGCQKFVAKPKRKTKAMPKCKNCAHPYSKHRMNPVTNEPVWAQAYSGCTRCEVCPGYEPARGIRQKRRTPEAAIRRIADGLWSKLVHARPGGCEIQQYHAHVCDGGFQAMHGIPRTFSATRWLPINGFKGCADAHMFFTKRPEAWSAALLEAWRLETFRELWALARASQPVDMDATVASLRAELARTEA